MDVSVTRSVLAAIVSHAQDQSPCECCGILLGHGSRVTRVIRTANLAADPARHFEIDPQALIDAHRAARAGGPEVVGYYHSHPGGPSAPSATDRAHASGDGRAWAIAGADGVAFWRDDESGFTSLSYIVTDG